MYFVLCFAFVFLTTPAAHAQTEQQALDALSPEADVSLDFEIVSELNIPKASVASRDNRDLTVVLEIENNGDKVESNIRYGAQLFKEGGVSDTLFFDEVFSLKPGELVVKSMVYPVPASYKGEIGVGGIIANTNGYIFSQTDSIETFTLEAEPGSLFIDVETCQLLVGEAGETSTLVQGVDVTPNETVVLDCAILNDLGSPQAYIPRATAYERSLAGPQAATADFSMREIAAGATERVQIPVPEIDKAQAYDVYFVLVNPDNKEISSNPVIARVVIQGESATIKNVQIDRHEYAKGDLANVTLLLGSQADFFGTEARAEIGDIVAEDRNTFFYNATVSLESNGRNCADPVTTQVGQGLDNGEFFTLQMPVTVKCPNPIVDVVIEGAEGVVLAQSQTIAYGANVDAKEAYQGNVSTSAGENNSGINSMVLGFIVLFLVIALLVLVARKGKGSVSVWALAAVTGVGLMGMAASADAVTLRAVHDAATGEYTEVNYNINDNRCQPTVSGTVTNSNCGNPWDEPNACSRVYVDGGQVANFTANGTTRRNFSANLSNSSQGNNSFEMRVQHSAKCNWSGWNPTNIRRDNYTVTSCGQPSNCGYRGGTVTSEPTNSQKCTNGGTVRNARFSSNRWTWECEGTNGVWDGGCYVNRALPPVNGRCGSANGTTTSSFPSSSTRCSGGNFSDRSDTSTQWRWQCTGENGGSTVQCSANKPAPVNGRCGSANRGSYSSFPNRNNCSEGSLSSQRTSSNSYTWTCQGQNGGSNASCSATRLVPENGSCGSNINNPCTSRGGNSSVAQRNGEYVWTCYGQNGGSNSVCRAPIPPQRVDGQCGSSHNGTYDTRPTSGLCAQGGASGVNGSGPWTWTCQGENGGSNSSCRANRSVPTPVCGNGTVESGEQCDDGNTRSGDGCSTTCQVERNNPVCGNGTVESGEQCDDGNTQNGDGCSSTCRIVPVSPVCGNGTVESGEQCDDGNNQSGDGCSATCGSEPAGAVCGNGTVETGEQCDDGNTQDGDGCSATCQTQAIPVCGNGTIEFGEQCDDGNAVDGDGCSATCQTQAIPNAVCGSDNGRVLINTQPTQLCTTGSPSLVTQNGIDWNWTCTSGTNVANCVAQAQCAADEVACGGECKRMTIQGAVQTTFDQEGNPIPVNLRVALEDNCRPPAGVVTCDVNGDSYTIEELIDSGIDYEVEHNNNGDIAQITCDGTTVDHKVTCVCTARKCSAGGACVAAPVIASSASSGACVSECSTNADCSGGSFGEVTP